MTHIEFFKYHNKHIKFQYHEPHGEIEDLSGVVIDIIKYNEKKTPTEYVFIPSNNLIEWKKADNKGENSAKEALQRVIDINNITSAEILNF